MKHVKLYEEFVNESITDNTLKSLISVLKMSKKMGIFDNEIFSEVKQDFIGGVYGTFKNEFKNIKGEQKKILDSYFNEMVKPLEKSKTLGQFIAGVNNIEHIKNRIKELSLIDESLDRITTWAKDKLRKGKEWWQDNKGAIIIEISKFLAEVIFHILAAILKGGSSNSTKFGGGRFGGGGSRGKW